MSVPKKKKVEEEDELDVEWEEVNTGGTAYKLSPNEWAIVKVISEPRPIKGGQSFIVDAEVIQWNGENPPKKGETVPMILQTLLAKAVQNAINEKGLPILVYAKNLGKKGKPYYQFEVKVAKPKGEEGGE